MCTPCYFVMYGLLLFQYNGSKLLGMVLYDMQLARKEVDFVSEVFDKKKLWLNLKQVEQTSNNRCVLVNCPRTCL